MGLQNQIDAKKKEAANYEDQSCYKGVCCCGVCPSQNEFLKATRGQRRNQHMIKAEEKYVFFYRSEDGDEKCLLPPYNGKLCTVYEESTRNEEDKASGGLWDVTFEDGFEADVYGVELEPVSNCQYMPKADIYVLMPGNLKAPKTAD